MCCCSKGKYFCAIIIVLFLAIGAGYVVLKQTSGDYFLENKAADDVVIADVGGQKVWLSDVIGFYSENPQLRELPLEAIYKDILNNVVDFKALAVAAEQAGIKDTIEYKKALKEAESQILRAVYIKAKLDEMVTEEALQNAYNEFVKSNPTEEEVEASHILVDSEAKAKDIITKLNKGEDFAKLAEQNSLDSSGKQGGQLGYFKKSAMVPEFADATFALKKGTYSKKPIKTMFGWHIVKVTDRRMSAQPSLDEIKDRLKMRISEKNFPLVIENAKKAAKVVLKPEAYRNKHINLINDGKENLELQEAEPVMEEVVVEEDVIMPDEEPAVIESPALEPKK